MNLVVNARDAMPTGGKADDRDRQRRPRRGLRVEPPALPAKARTARSSSPSARRSGTGMDRETQARIFEPFYTTKGKGKGTGASGSPTVASGSSSRAAEVSGSTASPAKARRSRSTSPGWTPRSISRSRKLPRRRCAEPRPSWSSRTRIRLRAVVLRVLQQHGVPGPRWPRTRAKAALLRCENHEEHVDLLLTDVVMPQMGGPELARRLQATRPTMKVLCMSRATRTTAPCATGSSTRRSRTSRSR